MLKDEALDRVCQNATRINQNNLQKILSDNQNTKYGKKLDFADIDSTQAYRKRVPLSDYSTYRSYVETMRKGTPNVLTVYPVVNYVKTSGTSGEPKNIPVTKEALQRYGDYIERYKRQCFQQRGGKRLLINTFRTNLHQEQGNQLILSECYYRYLAEEQLIREEEYAGGFPLLFHEYNEGMWYAKVWLALAEEELGMIESIFLYDQLVFFQYLEKHWKQVLSDMERGMIPPERGVDEKIQKILLQIPITSKRMTMIRQECEKGFDHLAPRIWPRLYMTCGIGNAICQSEDRALRRYLGELPVYYFSYVASECLMGVAMEVEEPVFVLIPETGFYEFIPYSESGQPSKALGEEEDSSQTLLMEELVPGQMYEIVITNFSGLYRYRLGDVIRVKDYYFGCPRVEFVFRKGEILNIAGEKMGIQQVDAAVGRMNQRYHCQITKYTFAMDEKTIPGRYQVALAVTGTDSEHRMAGYAENLDRALKRVNCDYEDLRNMGYIQMLEVLMLGEESYDQFMLEQGYGKGHNKSHPIAARGFEQTVWEKYFCHAFVIW